MTEILPTIRVSVRAVIVRDGAVLVQHKVYEDGSEKYVLPGGAVDVGETLADGLVRECHEEIGCTVDVRDVLHVADYFKPRDTEPPTTRQQLEVLFECRVPDTYIPQNGPHPDGHQRDVLWLNVADLCHKYFAPESLSRVLAQRIPDDKVYLGVID